MKRNWDVIRKVLLTIEELPPGGSLHSSAFVDDGIEESVVAYQMVILQQGGFIEGSCLDIGRGHTCIINSLTWAGQEFLDSIRSESIWTKIKETAKTKGLELTIDVVKAIASTLISQIVKSG